MIGHFEPEDLRGANQQNGFHARRFGRKALVEKSAEHVVEGTKTPQHGGSEPAHQRAVAVGEGDQAGMGGLAGQLLVERDLPPQDAVENVGGDPSGGEAGDFRLWGGARTRHGVDHCHELWLAREALDKKCQRFTALGGVRAPGTGLYNKYRPLQIVFANRPADVIPRSKFLYIYLTPHTQYVVISVP